MKVSVETRELGGIRADLVAVLMLERSPDAKGMPAKLSSWDRSLGGPIGAALASGDFSGSSGEVLMLYPTAKGAPRRLLLVGIGGESDLEAETLRRAAGNCVSRAVGVGAGTLAIRVPALRQPGPSLCAAALAEGAVLGAFRFDAYRSVEKKRGGKLRTVRLVFERLPKRSEARAAAERAAILAESQNLARNLSNQPANELTPAALAREARKLARQVGLSCRVMAVPELQRRKMGALLAVGQGSVHPPRLIVLEHKGGRAGTRRSAGPRPVFCLVGKGITFDSGGISIKPSAGMQDMKHDMSGAAAVLGAMRAVALTKLPLRVVGVIAAAENMPSGTAYRPGDIVRSMSGKTIEILNTDAEGRVVLADALHYALTTFQPTAMVDVATLTGACMIALGPWATGVFGTDSALVDRIRQAGEVTGERAWPMPLLKEHREAMKSSIADLKNTGGRNAGASTAAGFLSAFVGETPWVHLDIAGTGWTDKAGPYQPRGATGVAVRLLTETLRTFARESAN